MVDFNSIFEYLIIAFETIALFIFLSSFFTTRYNYLLTFVIVTVTQIIRRLVFEDGGPISLIPSTAIDIVFTHLCYLGKFKEKLFISITFYALIFITEAITLIILSLPYLILKNPVDLDGSLIPLALLSKSLLLSVILLLKKTLKIDSRIMDSLKYFPVPVFIVIAWAWGSKYTSIIDDTDKAILLIIMCIFSVMCAVYLVMVLKRSSEKALLQCRIEMLAENKEQSAAHYYELQAAYRQIERTAHDIKHHLDYIESAPDLESAVNYARKLKERSYSYIFGFTGNIDIDTIINAKNNEMLEKGIRFNVNDILPVSIDWLDAVDVSIILGNGLSNAIEACEHCNEKEITISFRFDDDWLLISIINPTGITPAKKKSGIGLLSSKKTAGHGLGMESMADSVERYGGMMKYEINNNMFRLDILLQANRKSK